MNIWIKSITAGGAVAMAVFFLSEKLNKKNTEKKYSIEYSVEAKADKESALPFSLSKIVDVLEKRLQKAEYKYKIEKSSGSTIHLSFSDVEDTLYPYFILTSSGRVQFRELYNIIEVKEMLMAAVGIMEGTYPAPVKIPEKKDTISKKASDLAENLEHAVEQEKKASISLIEFSQPYSSSEAGDIYYPSEIGKVKLKDTAAITELFRSEKVRILTPADLQIRFGEPNKKIPKGQKQGDRLLPLYFLKTNGSPDKALLENEDISDATQDYDQYGHVEIRVQFNGYGARKWATMTRQNIGRPIAIIVNGTVISAPTVISSIEDGSSSITGTYTIGEANEICAGLRNSKLPATLRVISSVVKQEKSTVGVTKKLLVTLITFIFIASVVFFVFKPLKST